MSISRTVLWVFLCLMLVAAAPLSADSKDQTMRGTPPPAPKTEAELRAELEQVYRTELETRVAQEKASYEGSIRSLWLSNAAVWTILLLFVALQALSARKRSMELARLRAERENTGG